MIPYNHDHLNRLRQLNLSLRAQLEQAEARIPAINDQIQQISSIKILEETFILAPVIFQRNYSDSTGPHTSGQVLQATLAVPGGLGVVVWDSEQYESFRMNLDVDHLCLRARFVRFEVCSPALKALIVPHVDSLLERLTQRFAGY